MSRLNQYPARHYYFTKMEYFRAELHQRSYYLASPLSFNDPYDCDLRVLSDRIATLTVNELKALRDNSNADFFGLKRADAVRAVMNRIDEGWTYGVGPASTCANISHVVNERMKMCMGDLDTLGKVKDIEEYRSRLRDWLSGFLSGVGVKCLTNTYRSAPMWAHYGGNHRDVCIGVYDVNHLFLRWRYNVSHFPVRYVSSVRDSILIVSLRRLIQDFMTVKFAEWSYEQESRVVSFRGNGFIPFRSTSVREIILGLHWFHLPTGEAGQERLRNRREFVEALFAFRRLQGSKRCTIFLAKAPKGGRGIERDQIPNNRLSFLLSASGRFIGDDDAREYILGNGVVG